MNDQHSRTTPANRTALVEALKEYLIRPTCPIPTRFDPLAPPVLEPQIAAVEARLDRRCHRKYRHLPWFQRTVLFSNLWDQRRRRGLGILESFFKDFTPRHMRADWEDFNLGRRLADSQGADYDQWLEAQPAPPPDSTDWTQPAELARKDAVLAYLDQRDHPAPTPPPATAPAAKTPPPPPPDPAELEVRESVDIPPRGSVNVGAPFPSPIKAPGLSRQQGAPHKRGLV